MKNSKTLHGIATMSFFAADHEAAKKWYSELLGIAPYFEMPGYAEFRIGDYEHELGLIDSAHAPKAATLGGPGGAVVFWHVSDVAATRDKLLSMGATEFEPIVDRTQGFITASVIDPFGNILGIMYNPHYLEILAAREKATAGK
jgi:predicted enzyme related to lactoylglutathione lyase